MGQEEPRPEKSPNDRVILRARCRRHFLDRIRKIAAFQSEAFGERGWDVSDFVRAELLPAIIRWENVMRNASALDFQGEIDVDDMERLLEQAESPLCPVEVLLERVVVVSS